MNAAVAGSSKKATMYVGGFAPQVNEQQLLDAFVTFGKRVLQNQGPKGIELMFTGDILEVSIPIDPHDCKTLIPSR